MIRSELPSYTSERYYLLSEIEQRAHFLYASAEYAALQDNLSTPENIDGKYAIYIAWDTNKGINGLKKIVTDVKAFCSKKADIDPSKSIISVEVYDPQAHKGDEDSESNKLVVEGYHYITEQFADFSYHVLGVTNNPGGTCALECITDYTHCVAPRENDHYALISLEDTVYLGLQEDREPDAIDNVYQYYISSQLKSVKEWASNINPYKKPDNHIPKPKSAIPALLGMYVTVAVISVAFVTQVLLKYTS